MKVGIVSVADMRHMTMISIYTEIFKKLKINYEIICTDRYNDPMENKGNVRIYQYSWNTEIFESKSHKIIDFIKFLIFAIRIIKEKKYDFLVIWNENTAILLSIFLIIFYKDKYCINIRDIGVDNKFVFKFMRNLAIKYSVFTTICSDRMKKYLPSRDYITIYSQNLEILKQCKEKSRFRKKDEVIRITFIGVVRFLEEDKKIIKAFGNDNRYIIQFYGTGSDKLKDYVLENGYKNVYLYGTFPVEKTAEILDNTDIIHAYYGNDYEGIELSIPIKFNYAPYLKIPVLVSPKMFCSELGEKYGFSYAIRDFELLADDLFEWYHNLDFETFKKNCNAYCTFVKNENKKLYDIIKELLNNKNN